VLRPHEKAGNCRVKPDNENDVDIAEREGLTTAALIAISSPPGTSGLSALYVDNRK
jgi:hypothetical protein